MVELSNYYSLIWSERVHKKSTCNSHLQFMIQWKGWIGIWAYYFYFLPSSCCQMPKDARNAQTFWFLDFFSQDSFYFNSPFSYSYSRQDQVSIFHKRLLTHFGKEERRRKNFISFRHCIFLRTTYNLRSTGTFPKVFNEYAIFSLGRMKYWWLISGIYFNPMLQLQHIFSFFF